MISHASASGGPFAWLPISLPTAVSGQGMANWCAVAAACSCHIWLDLSADYAD
ncbi:MAG: hypothetical protein H6656_17410 [Ardenticatenaceae bacterium]|nr:hypothetical protein [Ardenticatenaceae bacterium]